MSEERVLLTSDANPIYHDPNPTDSVLIEMQQRWKGKVLLEFYESGQYRMWEGGDPKNEVARYIVVWDEAQGQPRVFLDGLWTEGAELEKIADRNAVLAPGTTEEIREAFRAWTQENPHATFGIGSLDIDRRVPIIPKEGTVEDAQHEMASLFDTFMESFGNPK
jgi:hypothetical protein